MASNGQADFTKELTDMGLVVKHGKGSTHYKVYTREGVWVMDFAHTPGDTHWRKQATRRLRVKLGAIYGS